MRRDLPVRRATEPWPILVAEVMSQQTQIERIGPAWERFVGTWSEPGGLAAAVADPVGTPQIAGGTFTVLNSADNVL